MRNMMKLRKRKESVGDLLRYWRKFNRMNQMDLVDDLFRFVMDFETQVDGGVEVRRA